jgi:hypothetical protein
MKLFTTGFTQVFLIAINTFFISKEVYFGVFVLGFSISFLWSWNVKRVAFGTLKDRLSYSLGAAFGSFFGLIVSATIFKYIN